MAAGVQVAGGVAGGVVFEEGLVGKAEAVLVVNQQAGVPQEVLQERVPELRVYLAGPAEGLV